MWANLSSSLLGLVFAFFTPQEHAKRGRCVCTYWYRVQALRHSFVFPNDVAPNQKTMFASIRDLVITGEMMPLADFAACRSVEKLSLFGNLPRYVPFLPDFRFLQELTMDTFKPGVLHKVLALALKALSLNIQHVKVAYAKVISAWTDVFRSVTLVKHVVGLPRVDLQDDLTRIMPLYQAIRTCPCRLKVFDGMLPLASPLPTVCVLEVNSIDCLQFEVRVLDGSPNPGMRIKLGCAFHWDRLRTLERPSFAGIRHLQAEFDPDHLNAIMRCLLRARDLHTLALYQKRSKLTTKRRARFTRFLGELKRVCPCLSTLVLLNWRLGDARYARRLGLKIVESTLEVYEREQDAELACQVDTSDLTRRFSLLE